MPEKRKKKKKEIMPTEESAEKNEPDALTEKISEISAGLYYMSETDADILPYTGSPATEVSAAEILRQSGFSSDTPVEERDFDEFFDHLLKVHDWFEEEEMALVHQFGDLKKLLEENLTDRHVFKVGRIELDIYAVGLDQHGILRGIQTKAVET